LKKKGKKGARLTFPATTDPEQKRTKGTKGARLNFLQQQVLRCPHFVCNLAQPTARA
jgi:hypothetical protein